MFAPLRSRQREDWVAGYTFLAPAAIILLIFLVVPILFALWISFRDWSGLNPPAQSTWVGLRNYADLLIQNNIRRTDFFIALKNTTFYALGVVPLQTALALLLASIVNQKWLKGRTFFRTSFYLPSITSSVAISLIFMWLYQRNGLINRLIEAIMLGNVQPINWLASPNGLIHNLLSLFGITLRTAPPWLTHTEILGQTVWQWISGPSVALTAIMLLNIWTTSGTMMLIFMAALQDIPRAVYEAAIMDGATSAQTFRYVTVPMLRPTIFFVVTIGLIGTYQVFDQVYVMTAGGPVKTTLTVAYLVYRNGFDNAAMGVGAATAFILFVLIFVLTLIQRRVIGEKAA
ncbi:MAG: sugar ABC transporter permease [Ardenticatenaceae bacterium]|nr:sugar ABC transporter permease [Ardenticatenaceae bacterium]